MNSTLVQKQRVLFIRQKNNQFEEHQKIIIPLPCPFLGGTFPRRFNIPSSDNAWQSMIKKHVRKRSKKNSKRWISEMPKLINVSLKTRKKNGSGRRLHIIGQKTKLVG
jgi:hypothetical protein